MQIHTVSSSPATAIATSSSASTASTNTDKTVDYNAFLKLLVAQLKNQDPTSPTDSTQYMSQLASYSAVGQQVQTNTKLDALLANQQITQASGIIGHVVTSADGTITGKVASVMLQSGGSVATLENGKKVTLGDGVTISAN